MKDAYRPRNALDYRKRCVYDDEDEILAEGRFIVFSFLYWFPGFLSRGVDQRPQASFLGFSFRLRSSVVTEHAHRYARTGAGTQSPTRTGTCVRKLIQSHTQRMSTARSGDSTLTRTHSFTE